MVGAPMRSCRRTYRNTPIKSFSLITMWIALTITLNASSGGNAAKQTARLLTALASKIVRVPLGNQEGTGLEEQAVDHMTKVDPSQWRALVFAGMQSQQGCEELDRQEQIQPVMAHMHRELLTDQPGGSSVGKGANLNRAGVAHAYQQRFVVGEARHSQGLQV